MAVACPPAWESMPPCAPQRGPGSMAAPHCLHAMQCSACRQAQARRARQAYVRPAAACARPVQARGIAGKSMPRSVSHQSQSRKNGARGPRPQERGGSRVPASQPASHSCCREGVACPQAGHKNEQSAFCAPPLRPLPPGPRPLPTQGPWPLGGAGTLSLTHTAPTPKPTRACAQRRPVTQCSHNALPQSGAERMPGPIQRSTHPPMRLCPTHQPRDQVGHPPQRTAQSAPARSSPPSAAGQLRAGSAAAGCRLPRRPAAAQLPLSCRT